MSGNTSASPVIAVPNADAKLYNHVLAPIAPAGRTWGVFSIFAMWMSDVHSVGGYTFAASLFFLGLTGWEVLLAMVVGITIVYFLMNLIGRPSLKYGTPFPVVARMAFGVMGANIAAGLRGIVGIVWYGVQTYFASKAVQALVLTFYPAAEAYTHSGFAGLSALGWFSFLFMWLFQLLIFLNGMETIRKFIDFCGPVVYVVMFALAIWMLSRHRHDRADGECRDADCRLFRGAAAELRGLRALRQKRVRDEDRQFPRPADQFPGVLVLSFIVGC